MQEVETAVAMDLDDNKDFMPFILQVCTAWSSLYCADQTNDFNPFFISSMYNTHRLLNNSKKAKYAW